MVTVTVVVAPAASVPDIGETTTFFVRPDGSETDQPTKPPEAVSVIVPVAGGATSSVVGVTLSVPGAAEMLTDADADAGADAETGLIGAADTVVGLLADVPLPPGVTLAATTVPSLTLGVGPAPGALPGTGPAAPVALVVPPAGGGTT